MSFEFSLKILFVSPLLILRPALDWHMLLLARSFSSGVLYELALTYALIGFGHLHAILGMLQFLSALATQSQVQ